VVLATLTGAAVLALLAGLIAAGLPSVDDLAQRNPTTTALIEQRIAEAKKKGSPLRPRMSWVSLDDIAPALVSAVQLSEDAGFYGHKGFDWYEMEQAAKKDLKDKRFARGASTITQQLAKNLYFGTEKTITRKLKEALMTVKLERTLEKRRILSLYLNVIEWGEGVFGAEAGAQHRFGRSARSLSTAQAAVMAAMVPAPRRVNLATPTAWLKKRARRAVDLLLTTKRISADEHMHASAELERILAGPTIGDEEVPEEEEYFPAEPLEVPPLPSPSPSDRFEAEPSAAPEHREPEPEMDVPPEEPASDLGDEGGGTPI
jgi:monofunctional biosynthetic peptidoglycan transglycosylase